MSFYRRLSLLLLLAVTSFSFNSCSHDEPEAPKFSDYKFTVEVFEGYSMIYDITCEFTDVCTGEVQSRPVGKMGENIYYGRNNGEAKVTFVDFKIIGKLKDNAKSIADAAIAKGEHIIAGHSAKGIANVYSDPECTTPIKNLFYFEDFRDKDIEPEELLNYINNHPTIVILDTKIPVK